MSDNQTPPGPPPVEGGDQGNGEIFPPLNIADELRDSYLNYAMSVIVSRALPDVRDGLKPSQRRILLAMNDLGLGPHGGTSKCAGIVGETMKRYHPHGDTSIYPTLVRMAQDWNMRHRLIHPQGNFGSIAGLPPAAMRYTEARLTPIAADMLDDLNSDTVDFIDNYDGKYREPIVLPCKFPNLLVNGSDGIAVGMATDIPPHNLREVCDGLIKIIEEPEVSLIELMGIIPGPDFPTGGIILGRSGIFEGYTSGRGRITLRARATIVEDASPQQIIIQEVPFQVTRNKLATEIGNLVKNERIKGIREIRDESSARNGEPVRLVIYLKRDGDPDLILNQLYQYSSLQKTVSLIMLALVDNRPRELSIKQMLEEFLRHRVQVVRRRTEFRLREAKKRAHILEGLLIAISSLDEIIQICRQARSRAEAKVQLQNLEVASAVLERALGTEHFQALQRDLGSHSSYFMTEAQSDAVVRMQLGQLAALERDEIVKEYNGLREQIVAYEELLSDEANIREVIKTELTDIRDKYGEARKTEISEIEAERVNLLDLIPDEECLVTISHQGYIKRLPMDTFRSQRRGGKGVTGGQTRENDFIEHFFTARTHDYLLCFTNRGQLYWLRVVEIPQMSRTALGRAMPQVLSLREEEKISSLIPVRELDVADQYLVFTTRKGRVKKTVLREYRNVRAGGIIGITLEEGDTLINVALVEENDEILLGTRDGMAIRFSQSDVRPMGRGAQGVKGITLKEDDEVVGMVVTNPDGYLLTVCENGYGKRTAFGQNTSIEEAVTEEAGTEEAVTEEAVTEEADAAGTDEESLTGTKMYRRQKRGGKGVRDIQTSARNGKVVGIVAVESTDDIMLISSNGMVQRTHVNQVSVVGRNTQGVRVMNINEGDKVAVVAPVAHEEDVAEEEEVE